MQPCSGRHAIRDGEHTVRIGGTSVGLERSHRWSRNYHDCYIAMMPRGKGVVCQVALHRSCRDLHTLL